MEPPAPTVVEGANSWVDDFSVGGDVMLRFNDGDMGYRVFVSAGQSPGKSRHFMNQNHWMLDARNGFNGGASISPARSFAFKDGRFVVEGDFAAAIPEYSTDAWGEITITSAAVPTGEVADKTYAYGQFGGH